MNFFTGFRDELAKYAATLETQLLPHQKRVVKRIKEQPGLLVAHGLGSGKTLSSIAAISQLAPMRAQVLVPASLKSEYEKEIKKHVKGKLPIAVGSLQEFATRQKVPRRAVLVVDEAHRLRSPFTKSHRIVKKSPAKKRLLLTATPIYNRPQDIAPLINLAAGGDVLPTGEAFEEKHIYTPSSVLSLFGVKPSLKKEKELREILEKWVDYYKSKGEHFPDVSEERITTNMTKKQTQLHDAAWGNLPLSTRIKLFAGVLPDKKTLSDLNAFESQTRQIATTEKKFLKAPIELSPKMDKAVNEFVKQKRKAIVYSNYLSPLEDYSKQLEARKIKHGIYSGQAPTQLKKEMVDKYNEGKIDALLVSSAGSEGLNLKGTRLVQILEPHWNDEKINQIIGRAIRYKSHSHLPKKQRNVHIQKYEAKPLGRKRGIEQVLYDLSEKKTHLNRQLHRLLTGE